ARRRGLQAQAQGGESGHRDAEGLPRAARGRHEQERPQAARRGQGPDPRVAVQRAARVALHGLAVARSARASPRGGARLNPAIFRAYDIRGVAERDFDAAFAERLGLAFGTRVVEAGAARVSVGRDCRLTSARYADALVAGLRATGVAVVDVG